MWPPLNWALVQTGSSSHSEPCLELGGETEPIRLELPRT